MISAEKEDGSLKRSEGKLNLLIGTALLSPALRLIPGSAAALADVREGDYILYAQGMPISSSRDLLRVRSQLYAGDSLSLTLWRGGETVEVTLLFP